MKTYKNIAVTLIICSVISILTLGTIYRYMISPISNDDTLILIDIKKGATLMQIGTLLKENNLIKNEFIFKLYLRMHNISNLQAGRYNFKENMGLKKIIEMINKGDAINPDSINITFPEGKNMRQIAAIIAANTNNTVEDLFNQLNDEAYLDELIKQYWFLTDEIKNTNLYYSLEGYLFPNTYNIANKEVTIRGILEVMLKETDKVLTKYKTAILDLDFSVHELLTLASIVESEGINDEDRGKIAGVFYNRLQQQIPFQSCVTACYATKTDNCVPSNVNKNYQSPYNTYLGSLTGKLPIGPISNPGEAAIKATINPIDHDFLFFCADIYKHTYFTKTVKEHDAQVAKLKKAGIFPH